MNQPWIYMYSPSRSPPPTSLSTQSLWVFPVHQVRALVSWIQPGLVVCFTLDNIHVLMLFSWNIPPLPSPTESKLVHWEDLEGLGGEGGGRGGSGWGTHVNPWLFHFDVWQNPLQHKKLKNLKIKKKNFFPESHWGVWVFWGWAAPSACLAPAMALESVLGLSTSSFTGSDGKESTCNARSLGLIPGSGRPPGVMATHSSIFAWKIPWTEEPGGLKFMGS